MKYQENDSFVIFLSRVEQSPLRKVAAMDKSSKPSAAMRSIQLLTLSVIFALTGCLSLAPDYQRPAAPVPQQFSLSQNKLVTATAGYQETGWRTFFVDPQVKSLISTALANNRDLRMATLKVQEARAQYRVTDADRYPQLNGDGSTTYGGKLKGDTTTSSDYAAGLNLSYDLDFFGRLKNLSDADRQNFFASEEARRAVHILLIANVSQSYFNQRLAAAQLQVANDTLQNYQQSYACLTPAARCGTSSPKSSCRFSTPGATRPTSTWRRSASSSRWSTMSKKSSPPLKRWPTRWPCARAWPIKLPPRSAISLH